LALAGLALVVFGAYNSYPKSQPKTRERYEVSFVAWCPGEKERPKRAGYCKCNGRRCGWLAAAAGWRLRRRNIDQASLPPLGLPCFIHLHPGFESAWLPCRQLCLSKIPGGITDILRQDEEVSHPYGYITPQILEGTFLAFPISNIIAGNYENPCSFQHRSVIYEISSYINQLNLSVHVHTF